MRPETWLLLGLYTTAKNVPNRQSKKDPNQQRETKTIRHVSWSCGINDMEYTSSQTTPEVTVRVINIEGKRNAGKVLILVRRNKHNRSDITFIILCSFKCLHTCLLVDFSKHLKWILVKPDSNAICQRWVPILATKPHSCHSRMTVFSFEFL